MKKLIILITLLLVVKGYTQHPDLTETTWYLHKMVIDNEDYYSPHPNLTGFLYFYETLLLEVSFPYCEDGYGGTIANYQELNIFEIEHFSWALIGLCYEDDFDFMKLHYSLFAIYDVPFSEKNPFTYTITTDSNGNKELIIINTEGDEGHYGDTALSTTDIETIPLVLYPNPVINVLTISSKESVKEVTIYDIQGKQLNDFYYNSSNTVTKLDVSALQNGMYFLKIETDNSTIATERFIKK